MEDFQWYFKLGLDHVLDWKAYDHVLFLMVLTILYGFKDWKKVLGLVTFFTLGHTLTLALSAYNLLYIEMDLIEFLIPLTILFTALFNIIFVNKSSNYLNISFLLAFLFGLIHGLGFSSYFKILVDDFENKLFPLIEFAIGIEIAQIIVTVFILIINYLILNILKRQKRDWIIVVSSIVAGIVIPMLIERKFW